MENVKIDFGDVKATTVYHSANFDDASKLIKMFIGADTLFLTVNYTEQFVLQHYRNIIDAAATAKVKDIIFLSPIPLCTDTEYLNRHYEIEDYIKKQKDFENFTRIRTNFTFQDFLTWNPCINDTEDDCTELHFPIPEDMEISLLDSADISEMVSIISDDPNILGGKGWYPCYHLFCF